MDGDLVVNPEDLEGLSSEAILELLDRGWPWPLDAVQHWFEDLWNDILGWFHSVVDWVYNRVKPLITQVWDWITSKVEWLWAQIRPLFDKVYDWLRDVRDWLWDRIKPLFDKVYDWLKSEVNWLWQNVLTYLRQLQTSILELSRTVATKVAEINKWFSDEFIDPFIDWLVKLPDKIKEALLSVWHTVTDPIAGFFRTAWEWLENAYEYYKWFTGMVFTPGTPERSIAIKGIGAFLGAVLVAVGAWLAAPIIAGVTWAGRAILAFLPQIGGWFATIFSRIGAWLVGLGPGLAALMLRGLGGISTYLVGAWVPLIASGAILALSATGKLEELVDRFVTPAIMEVFNWFERMGPVAPQSGANISQGITKIATFTISGLAAMTLGGELLSPLKHLGMGHISAIIYDLINYKTLTAAFMGVLAFVYIKQPLTYYYQRVARPNLPDEMVLTMLASEYMLADRGDVEATVRGDMSFAELAQLNKVKFIEMMGWHGYPDEWSEKMFEKADTPMRYFALGAVARSGMWDEAFMRDELRNSGYSAIGCEFLLDAFRREATGDLKTLMAGAAMKRYREGLDDGATLQQNLLVLGVSPTTMAKYLHAAQLDYLTDYQSDLIAYWKDAYHRREVEENELRRGLSSAGLLPERLDLIVERERIKRVKAPTPTEPEVSSVRVDTIRRKRRKNLITRGEEIDELIAIGVASPDAVAFADNDDVRLAEKAGEE